MTAAIQPRPEEKQMWRPLYEHLRTKPYGYLVTYSELQMVLGFDPRGNRGDIYRAQSELERTSSRTLKCERDEGYKIAEPDEHEELALNRGRYARKHIQKAQKILAAAPRDLLTPEAAKRQLDLQARNSRLLQVFRSRGEQSQEVQEHLASGATRFADLEARLSRLEQGQGAH